MELITPAQNYERNLKGGIYMNRFLMKCGHVSNGLDKDDKPVCVICAGIRPGYNEVLTEVDGTYGLEGRQAKCPYCGKLTQSSWDLPFFKHKPDKEFDEFYDGCFGWD